jgi:hypothetical protein
MLEGDQQIEKAEDNSPTNGKGGPKCRLSRRLEGHKKEALKEHVTEG